MTIIKKLTVKTLCGNIRSHTVGKNGVTSIEDMRISAIPKFDIYVNGTVKFGYVNGVYEIEYEEKQIIRID